MKKILYFASMMLTVFVTSSCSQFDNPVDVPDSYTIVDDNGNKYETDLVATFQGVAGTEVSLTLGVYDRFDIYGVDFGDGKIVVDTVCAENGGLKGEDGLTLPGTLHTAATKFTGTVAGEGIIKVFGKSDIWYLIAEGGAMPTSLDQAKLKNVVQMTISGANVENITLPATEVLKTFNFNNSPVRNVDVSQAPNLTSLRIENLKSSPYDNNFTGIDVSNNTQLEYLYLGVAASDKEGNIASVDLSKNTAIQNVYISGVHLKSITLPENAAINTLNLSDNELTSIDVSKAGKIKSLNVSGNKMETLSLAGLTENSMSTLQANNNVLTSIDFGSALAEKVTLTINDNLLTELDVPVVTNNLSAQNNKLRKFSYKGVSSKTRYLRLQDNELTFATLPLKPELHEKAQYYVYAPQADMEVAPQGAVLDLSAQASAQGVLAAAVGTKFEFAVGETVLKAGEDYKETSVGIFEFQKSFQGVVCTMTSEAFPDLTLKTKAFNVTVGGASSAFFTFTDGAITGGNIEVTGSNKVGNEITVASKKASIETEYVLITLNEALKAGDVINMTGYRKKDTDANGNLYILFETGASIDEGNDVTWNNIHESIGQQPNTNTYEVSAEAAGSKTIKLARSKSGTNVFIQKIEIIHK